MLFQVGVLTFVVWLVGLPAVYVLYRFRRLQCIHQLWPRRLAFLFISFGFYLVYLYLAGSRVLSATDPSLRRFHESQEKQRSRARAEAEHAERERDAARGGPLSAAEPPPHATIHASGTSTRFGPGSSVFYDPYHHARGAVLAVYDTARSVHLRNLTAREVLIGVRQHLIVPVGNASTRVWGAVTDPSWWHRVYDAVCRLLGDIRDVNSEARVRSTWWPAEDVWACTWLAVAQAVAATCLYGSFCAHTNAMWVRGAAALRRRRQRAMVGAALEGCNDPAQLAQALCVGAVAPSASGNPLMAEEAAEVSTSSSRSTQRFTASSMGSSSSGGRTTLSGQGCSSQPPFSGAAAVPHGDGANLRAGAATGVRHANRNAGYGPWQQQPQRRTTRLFGSMSSSSGNDSGHFRATRNEFDHEGGSSMTGVAAGAAGGGVDLGGRRRTSHTNASGAEQAGAAYLPGSRYEDGISRILHGGDDNSAGLPMDGGVGMPRSSRHVHREDVSRVHQLPMWVTFALSAFPFLLVCVVQLTTIHLTRMLNALQERDTRASAADTARLVILSPPLISTVALIGLFLVAFEYAALQRYRRLNPLYRIAMDAETPFEARGKTDPVTDAPVAPIPPTPSTASLQVSPVLRRIHGGTAEAAAAHLPALVPLLSTTTTTAAAATAPLSRDGDGRGARRTAVAATAGTRSRLTDSFFFSERSNDSCRSSGSQGGGAMRTIHHALQAGVVPGAFGAGKNANRYLDAVPRPAFVYITCAGLSHVCLVLSPSSPLLWCLALLASAGAATLMMHYYLWQPMHWLVTEYSKLCGRSAFTVLFSPHFAPFDLAKGEDELAAEAEGEDQISPVPDEQAASAMEQPHRQRRQSSPANLVIDLERVHTDVPIAEVVKAATASSSCGSAGGRGGGGTGDGDGGGALATGQCNSSAGNSSTAPPPPCASVTGGGGGGGGYPLPKQLPMRFWSAIAARLRWQWDARSARTHDIAATGAATESPASRGVEEGGKISMDTSHHTNATAEDAVAVAARATPHSRDDATAAVAAAVAAAAAQGRPQLLVPPPAVAAAMLPIPAPTGSSLAPVDLRGSMLLTSPQAAVFPTAGAAEGHAPRPHHHYHGNNPISNSMEEEDDSFNDSDRRVANTSMAGGRRWTLQAERRNSGSDHSRSSSGATKSEKDPTIEDFGAVVLVDTDGNRFTINDANAAADNGDGGDGTTSSTNHNANAGQAEGNESSATSSALGADSMARLSASFSLRNPSLLSRALWEENESFARFIAAVDADGDNTAALQKLLHGHGKTLVERRDDRGRTALHHATLGGFVTGVLFLLGLGADPNARDSQGEASLHMAVQSHTGNSRLNHRADQQLSITAHLITQVTGHHTTPIAAAMASHRYMPPAAAAAMRRPTKGLIAALVEGGADVNLPTSLTGLTPLHLAVVKNEVGVMSTLLRLGANPTLFLKEDAPAVAAPSPVDPSDAPAAKDDEEEASQFGHSTGTATPRQSPDATSTAVEKKLVAATTATTTTIASGCPCQLSWAEVHLSNAGIASSGAFRKSPMMLAVELNADMAVLSMLTTARERAQSREHPLQPSDNGARSATATDTAAVSSSSFLSQLLPRCEDHQLSVLQVALALGHAATVYTLLQYLNEESHPSAMPLASRTAATSRTHQAAVGAGGMKRVRHKPRTATAAATTAVAVAGPAFTGKRRRMRRQQRALEKAGVVSSAAMRARRFTCSRELQCEHERKTVFHFAALGDSTESLAYLLEVGFHVPDFVPANSDFTWADTAWQTRRFKSSQWHQLTPPSSVSRGIGGGGTTLGSSSTSSRDAAQLDEFETDQDEYEDIVDDKAEGVAGCAVAGATEVDSVQQSACRDATNHAPAREEVRSSGTGKKEPDEVAAATMRKPTNTGSGEAGQQRLPHHTASLTTLAASHTAAAQRRHPHCKRVATKHHKRHVLINSVVQLVAQRLNKVQVFRCVRHHSQLQQQQQQHASSPSGSQRRNADSAMASPILGSTANSGFVPSATASSSLRFNVQSMRYGAVHVSGASTVVRAGRQRGATPSDATAGAAVAKSGADAVAEEAAMSFGAAVVKLRQRAPGVPIDLAHLEQLESAIDTACVTGGLSEAERKRTQGAMLVVSQRLWQLDQAERRCAGVSVYGRAPAALTGAAATALSSPNTQTSLAFSRVGAGGLSRGAGSLSGRSSTAPSSTMRSPTMAGIGANVVISRSTSLTHMDAMGSSGTTSDAAAATALFVDLASEDIVLSYIAVCLNQCDNRGMTPLHYAIVNQNANMVFVLCIYGARFVFTSEETQKALTAPEDGAAAVGGEAGFPSQRFSAPASPSLTPARAPLAPPPSTPVTCASVASQQSAPRSCVSQEPPRALPKTSSSPKLTRQGRIPSRGAMSEASSDFTAITPPSVATPLPAVAGHLTSPVVDDVAPAALAHATDAFMDSHDPAVRDAFAVAAKTEDAGEFLAALPAAAAASSLKNSITAITPSGPSLTRSFVSQAAFGAPPLVDESGLPSRGPSFLRSVFSNEDAAPPSSVGASAGGEEAAPTTTADAAMITAALVLQQLAQTEAAASASASGPSYATSSGPKMKSDTTAPVEEDVADEAIAAPAVLLATKETIAAVTAPARSTDAALPMSAPVAGTETGPHNAPRSLAASQAGRRDGDARGQERGSNEDERGEGEGEASGAAAGPPQQQQQQQVHSAAQPGLLLRGMIEPHDVFLMHIVRNPIKAEMLLWAATEGMSIHARVVEERTRRAAESVSDQA